MAFHPHTRLIRKLFNAYRFGPPSRVTGTSPWASVDHLVSRLPHTTMRPLQARFRCGCASRDAYPRRTRQLVGSLCKRHAVTRIACSDRLWAHGFRYSFTPLEGVLFTFPSRYLYTIGLTGVFSLAGWARRIQTGLLVSRPTQGSATPASASHTGLSPSTARLSGRFRSRSQCDIAALLPRGGIATAAVWALPRSLATTGGITCCFLFLRVLRCFSSPRSPPRTAGIRG